MTQATEEREYATYQRAAAFLETTNHPSDQSRVCRGLPEVKPFPKPAGQTLQMKSPSDEPLPAIFA